MASNTKEKDIITNLAELLRENGERILSGSCKLSLTTNSLTILNDCFSMFSDEEDFTTSFEVQPANSPRFPIFHDLQFLFDFVQKTIALKVIHGTNTLQGAVNISSFRALRTLEIKKTPIHLLEGIHKLRSKLRVLICTRCLKQIQDIVEQCGGDRSTPMSWPQLHTACLSFNFIEELDASLRLLPAIEVLDLSHNAIKKTDSHLEYLTELCIVNLGYNHLVNVPSVALSCRSKLQVLILRNNNLDSLKGMEELTGLRELDVANNCLCDHSVLDCIRPLSRLTMLMLCGNPLSFHAQHRKLTLEKVHPMAASRMSLDGKPFSPAELVHRPKFSSNSSEMSSEGSSRFPNVPSSASLNADISCDSSTAFDYDSDLATPLRVKKRSKKGSRKARRVLISDMDTEEDATSGLDSETPVGSLKGSYSTDSNHLEMKDHLEVVRNQLGPDWLQTLQTGNQKHQDTTVPHEQSNGIAATADDLYLNEQEDDSEQVFLNKDIVFMDSNTEQVEMDIEIINDKDNISDNIECVESVPEENLEPARREGNARLDSTSSEIEINWQGSRSDNNLKDYGVESEPFIISYLDGSDQLLVTLTDRYLLEKDLDGNIIEKLDLKCLQTVHKIDEVPLKGGEHKDSPSIEIGRDVAQSLEGKQPMLRLLFDYQKKDRRERKYLMEDEENAQIFMGLVQPVLEMRVLTDQLRDQMQCLKCNKQFNKNQAKRHIRRSSIGGTQIDVYSSTPEKGMLEEGLNCPYCSSDILIELDASELARQMGSNSTTPIGSYSTPLGTTPIATSSAKPSPYKREYEEYDETQMTSSYMSTATSYRSVTETMYLSPEESGVDTITIKRSSGSENSRSSGEENTFSQQKHQKEHLGTNSELPTKLPLRKVTSLGGISENDFMSENLSENRVTDSDVGIVLSQRKRQNSTQSVDSDILVLSRNASVVSQESDIQVLSNPSLKGASVIDSESSIDVMHSAHSSMVASGHGDLPTSPVQERDGFDFTDNNTANSVSIVNELSPCGSLTNKTLNSMIESVYEKSIFDGNKTEMSNSEDNSSLGTKDRGNSLLSVGSFQSAISVTPQTVFGSLDEPSNRLTNGHIQKTELGYESFESSCDVVQVGNIRYWYDDFSQIDHKLKLHFNMTMFEEQDEEFALILRGKMIQYTKGEELESLLVVSTHRFYILRINKRLDESDFSGLKVILTAALTDVRYIDIGLGYQSFRLEFGTESSCFTFLLRDEKWCQRFISQLTAHLQQSALSSHSKLEGITKNNPKSLANLELDVLLAQVSDDRSEDSDIDTNLQKYILCFLHTGEVDAKGEKSPSPVSLALTTSHICLVKEDFRWPIPRCATNNGIRGHKQFLLQDKHKVNDITQLDLKEEDPWEIKIYFMDELTSEESSWVVTMETKQSQQALLQSIREPWEQQFGVDLQINLT